MMENYKLPFKMSRPALDYIVIFMGNLLYALSVVLFIRPAAIPLGGVSGIAMMINFFTGMPIGTMIILMNIPLFVISARSLGKSFFIKTVAATIFSSLMIDVLDPFLRNVRITEDDVLASLYGGVLSGVGLGLVFWRGATTGGSDILSKMLNRKFQQYSIGRFNLIINVAVILLAAILYRKPEAALYAMIVQYVSSSMIDAIISGFDHSSAALIVTHDPDKMSAYILQEMHRGCTGFKSQGMYTKSDQTTLLVAVRNHETTLLKKIVTQTDPGAFIILLNAREVLGHGFKSYGQ